MPIPDDNATEARPPEPGGQPAPETPSQERTSPTPTAQVAPSVDYSGEIQTLRQELAALRSLQQSNRDIVTNALTKRLGDEYVHINRLAKRNNWTAEQVAEQKAMARNEALDLIAEEPPTPAAPTAAPESAPNPAPPAPPQDPQLAILSYVLSQTKGALAATDPEALALAEKYSKLSFSTPAEKPALDAQFDEDLAEARVTAKARKAKVKQQETDAARVAEGSKQYPSGTLMGGGTPALTQDALTAQIEQLNKEIQQAPLELRRALMDKRAELLNKLKV